MTSSTHALPSFGALWGHDFYSQPDSPTTLRNDVTWTPAAGEILADPIWAAKVARGLEEANAAQGISLAEFRRTLDG